MLQDEENIGVYICIRQSSSISYIDKGLYEGQGSLCARYVIGLYKDLSETCVVLDMKTEYNLLYLHKVG